MGSKSNCKWFDDEVKASSGECVGASQLCWKHDKSYCDFQTMMNAPCEWKSTSSTSSTSFLPPSSSSSSGQCQGNDSRCAGRTTKATCNVGDCRWKFSTASRPGTCVG